MRKSINKTTVIIVLAIFLTISVGYALFSDTITIEGTATAQGNFDIEATCITNVTTNMFHEFGLSENYIGEFDEGGYKDVSCIVNDDTINFSVGFDYPGAKKWYLVKMKNNGNAAATFDLDEWWSGYWDDINNTIKKYDINDNLIGTITTEDIHDDQEYTTFFNVRDHYVVEDTNGNYFNAREDEKEFENFVVPDTSKLKLEPGESLYLFMNSIWPEKNFSEENVKYVATTSFSIDWQQYTN